MADLDPFATELSTLLRSSSRDDPVEHPAVEEIVAYHETGLSAQREGEVQEHLTSCSECLALLLDLENFEDLGPAPGQADLAPDLASLRRSLNDRLEAEGLRHGANPPATPAFFQTIRVPPAYWISALAATLVLIAALVAQIWRSPDPRSGATVSFLLSPESYREEAVPTFEVPTWAGTFVLTMVSIESLKHQTVAAEIREAETQRLALRAEQLYRSPDETLAWSLHRSRLPPGSYRIQLFSPQGEPLDTYRFRLALEAPPG